MNLNKWLCKTFDMDKKGYVTIADIANVSDRCIFLSLLVSVGIYSVYRFVVEGGFYKPNPEPFTWHMLGASIIVMAIIALVLLTIVTIYEVFITYIANIKVAKCPLKENENK